MGGGLGWDDDVRGESGAVRETAFNPSIFLGNISGCSGGPARSSKRDAPGICNHNPCLMHLTVSRLGLQSATLLFLEDHPCFAYCRLSALGQRHVKPGLGLTLAWVEHTNPTGPACWPHRYCCAVLTVSMTWHPMFRKDWWLEERFPA